MEIKECVCVALSHTAAIGLWPKHIHPLLQVLFYRGHEQLEFESSVFIV